MKNTRASGDTSKNRARKDKNESMMRLGKDNGAWKGGISPHYYRRLMKAKPGQIVLHKNDKLTDNRKANLKVVQSMEAFNKAKNQK